MLVACIIVIITTEIISFAQKKNFELYANEETLPEKPVVDMSTKDFLILIRSIYPEDKPYFGMQDKFFTVDFFATRVAEENMLNGIPWNPDRRPLKKIPCEELETELSNVNYSKEDLKGAFCIKQESGTLLGGSVESGVMHFLGLQLSPCKVV